ncbi:endolytic transglycosylase MltG [Paenibacillus sp. GCM10023248]|uniref:endolytic transglycosylase MltG n=1 Tax=Bacillales TaxID=1385 RepID=UPI00237838A0|nr:MULTISPECIES: endolytic transglycosylase MltG [Bacillales]MDD9269795.1 endolytic transglycosylase MltG [Paenibacillus sp. MAHUQ-63]
MLDHGSEGNEPRKRTRRIVLIVIGLILLLLVGTAAGIGLFIVNAMQPVAASEQEVRVSIPQGAGSVQIAKELEAKGLIKNSSIFTYYLKLKKQGSRFQAGEYGMKPGITFDQVIDKLNKGETVKEEVIRVTIPEGYTIEQIAAKLSEGTPWSKDVFLQMANAPADLKSETALAIPDNKNLKHKLEGYLFPETYEFKKGSTEQEFIERTLQELDKKLATLPPDWKDKLKERGLTVHQMLTIASLIEREVVQDEERALVSGVIQNRLKKNMPLQIDATVQYLFDKSKERLLEKDLQIQSPYNTYLNTGLPPGPIASPSLASMKAAIYPEETKYLFYVTKKDGTKGHLFAETFEEHKKNIAESKKAAN